MRRGLLSILLALLLTVGKSQVVGFEYFIDSDPGVGNGIPLELEPGSSVEGFYDIPLNTFEQGFHRIGLRSHDIHGAYSQTLIHSFFISPSSSSELAEVEYYIDSDPGQGNGVKIPLQMDSDGSIRYIIPLSEVSVGGHLLGIRTKNSLGFWSQTQLHFFYNRGDGELADIIRFEYYFTGDGAGDTVFSHIVEEPSSYVELDFVANVSELVPDREYEMHIYAVSDDGRRSLVAINRVNICSDEPPSADFSYVINDELVDLTNISNNYSEIKWLLEEEVFSTGETTSFAYGDPGIFEVGLIASNYCTADTLYQYITVPGIEKIYPTVGTIQQKEATITITGFGFDSIPSLRLYDESGKTILPTQVIKADSLNLRAVFNLSEVEVSKYNLQVIVNEGQDTLSSSQVFTVLEAGNIPFDEWVPFEIAAGEEFVGDVLAPEAENLFVFMKKGDRIGYDGTWYGEARLRLGEETLASWSKAEDFGFRIKDPLSTIYSIDIHNDRNYAVSGLVKVSYAPEWLKLNEWQKGEILRPYGYDWKYFDIGDNVDSLYFKTEGYGLWSTIEVFYQDMEEPEERWTFSNMGAGYAIQGNIPNPKEGRYYIRYKDSAVLQNTENDDQKREYLVYVGTKISPASAPHKQMHIRKLNAVRFGQGLVTLLIDGHGMKGNEAVQLSDKNGLSISPIKQQFVSEEQRYEVSFDFTDVEIGEYELKMENNTVETDPLVQMLRVEAYKDPEFEINVLTRESLRIGRFQELQIELTNRSNLDAVGTLLSVELPDYVEWFSEEIERYSFEPVDFENFEGVTSWDEIPIDFIIDRDGEARKVIPIMIPHIAPNESRFINLRIKSNELERFTVNVHSDASIIINNNGIVQTRMIASKLYAVNCLHTFLTTVLSKALAVGPTECFKAASSAVAAIPLELVNRAGRERRKKFDWFSTMVVNPANVVVKCAKFAGLNHPAIRIGLLAYESYSTYKTLWDDCSPSKINEFEMELYGIGSVTPEDKYGPTGYDQGSDLALENRKRFVPEGQLFEYKIDYWNKEDATAPAAEVFIRDTLHTNFDINTFNFTEIGFLRWKLPLEGGKYFNVTVDMRPEKNLLVNVEGTLDMENRVVFWTHRSLDPETMELPEDPMAGYLPPIDSTGYNIGWVNFTIAPVDSLGHNVMFQNQAHVNFDGVGPWGPAPPYGPYTNTIDLSAPASYVKTLPATVDPEFEVQWGGSDDGAGIQYYDVYVSKNDGEFELWLTSTSDSLSTFQGETGNSYAFYSIAIDYAGNKEAGKTKSEATTKVLIRTFEIEDITTTSPICTGADNGSVTINTSSTNVQLEYSLDNTTFQDKNSFEDLAPGNYTAYVRDKADQENAVQKAFTIDPAAHELPDTPTISIQGEDGRTQELLLVSSSATGNQWYKDGAIVEGATAQSIEASEAGTYHVVVTGAGGCSAASEMVTITALPEVNNLHLTLYPNPADTYTTIKLGREVYVDKVTVYSALGIVLKETDDPRTATEIRLDLRGLVPGIYFVQVEGIGFVERLNLIIR